MSSLDPGIKTSIKILKWCYITLVCLTGLGSIYSHDEITLIILVERRSINTKKNIEISFTLIGFVI